MDLSAVIPTSANINLPRRGAHTSPDKLKICKANSLQRKIARPQNWLYRLFLPQKYSLRASAADSLSLEFNRAVKQISDYQSEIESCNTQNSAPFVHIRISCILCTIQFADQFRTLDEVFPIPTTHQHQQTILLIIFYGCCSDYIFSRRANRRAQDLPKPKLANSQNRPFSQTTTFLDD